MTGREALIDHLELVQVLEDQMWLWAICGLDGQLPTGYRCLPEI